VGPVLHDRPHVVLVPDVLQDGGGQLVLAQQVEEDLGA
jgi:hypothetical protein